MTKSLRDLAEFLGLSEAQYAQTPVGNFRLDSRDVQRGDVFFAVAGQSGHGIDHAKTALENGAALIVADCASSINDERIVLCTDLEQRLVALAQWRYARMPYPRIIAITGTNGKTSVAWYIAMLLNANGIDCGYVGTLGNGRIHALQSSSMTTPNLFDIHRLLAEAAADGLRWMSIEASSHALDQGRLNGIDIEGAVFTTFSRDHIDYHGSMEAYFAAKHRLLERPELKWAVVNTSVALKDHSAHPPQLYRYGNNDGDVPFKAIATPNGLNLELEKDGERLSIDLGLYGQYQGENICAALTVVSIITALNIDKIRGMTRLSAPRGRMEVYCHAGAVYVVDYAHTPDALATALKNLRAHNKLATLWVIIGCGGDRDPGKRPMMGAIAEKFADQVIITNDNPRSEDPQSIVNDMLAGMKKDHRVILDRATAIEYAITHVKAGDVVLIAGKGHEAYQEVGGVQLPFSDQETLLQMGAHAGVSHG